MASKARDLSNFISTAAIDASEIGTGAITTDKIADTTITHAKLHTTMDLSGKTVTLPTINALDVTNNINVGGTVDGVDIQALNTTAGAALPKAGGTMTGVIAGFESTGIDDNATSTAITIDASENVLVGTTSTSSSTQGIKLRGDIDAIIAMADGQQAAYFGRLNSDGEIVSFKKDGTAVGSIGVKSNDLTIGTSDTGIRFLDGANSIMPVNPTTGADSDNALNLGVSSARWKDLYLSGGVYLGGTGAANKLDDYEEGTFNATVTTGTATYVHGRYVKVGRLVTASCLIYDFSNRTSTGDAVSFQLPFASISSESSGGGGNVMFRYISSVNDVTIAPYISGTLLELFQCNEGNYTQIKHSQLANTSARIYFTVTYQTDS